MLKRSKVPLTKTGYKTLRVNKASPESAELDDSAAAAACCRSNCVDVGSSSWSCGV